MGRPSRIEQIYADIKQALMTQGLRPGHRVDVEALAIHYGVSTIPIRMLMQRLVGEGILEAEPQEGYVLPWMNEAKLGDLLRWNQQILLSTLEAAMSAEETAASLPALTQTDGSLVAETETLFLAIADLEHNQETQRAVRNVNDRLRPIRLRSKGRLLDRDAELGVLKTAWTESDLPLLHKSVWQYHRRRLDLLPHLVALAYSDMAC